MKHARQTERRGGERRQQADAEGADPCDPAGAVPFEALPQTGDIAGRDHLFVAQVGKSEQHTVVVHCHSSFR